MFGTFVQSCILFCNTCISIQTDRISQEVEVNIIIHTQYQIATCVANTIIITALDMNTHSYAISTLINYLLNFHLPTLAVRFDIIFSKYMHCIREKNTNTVQCMVSLLSTEIRNMFMEGGGGGGGH